MTISEELEMLVVLVSHQNNPGEHPPKATPMKLLLGYRLSILRLFDDIRILHWDVVER